jgi:hypothetical protein
LPNLLVESSTLVIYLLNPFAHRSTALVDLSYICAQTLSDSGIDARRLVFQILPIELITNPNSYSGQVPLVFKELSFGIYDRCRTEIDALSLHSPAYTLANPSVGSIPKFNFKSNVKMNPVAVMEPDRVLHVAYALSNGWVCACVSDCVGEVFQLLHYRVEGTLADVFTRLWRDVGGMCGFGGICWRIVICKSGRFTAHEINGLYF